MAIQPQGAAGHLLQQPKPGPAVRGLGRSKDPPVQELPGGEGKIMAVAHQDQGRRPRVAPGQQVAEVGGGLI